MNIVIATIHTWNIVKAENFKNLHPEHNVTIITDKNQLTKKRLDELKPRYVLFTHWSWILPAEIFDNFECIVFHVSDVPNSRGGSPVQNQIEMGMDRTKISAIRVDEGLDTGDVYVKEDLSLEGSAEEIFLRSSSIVYDKMIPFILENEPIPKKQKGKGYVCKRRRPAQSEIPQCGDLKKVFDHIRMLDAEGYPEAYIDWGVYRLFFSRASMKTKNVLADVRIEVRENN